MSTAGAQNRCVLLVDDDPFIVAVYVAKLKRAGLDVDAVTDGAEALRRLSSVRPDLVILDLNMPKLNGIEVLKHIRNTPTLATLPVLVLTNVCSDSVMREAWEARPTRYLIKRETTPNAVVEEVVALLQAAPLPAAAPAPAEIPAPAAPSADADWVEQVGVQMKAVLSSRTTDGFREALYRFRELVRPQLSQRRSQPEGSFIVLFADAMDSLFEEFYGHPENVSPSLLRAFELCGERLSRLFAPESSVPSRSFRVATVLVMSEDDVLRESLGRILDRPSFRPIRVGEMGAALHLLRENAFRLVVLDTGTGDDYLERIQALSTGAPGPVIVVTAAEYYRPSQKPGLERVSKPVNPVDLYVKALLLAESSGG